MKEFINKYFSAILAFSGALGFVIPNAGNSTSWLIPLLLSVVMFSSYFQIDFSPKVFLPNLTKSFIYFLVRNVALAILVFYLVKPFSEFYTPILFVLVLLPAAVSSPAFTRILQGNTPLAISSVMLGNILSPLLIPFLCALFLGDEQHIDGLQMAKTLMMVTIAPLLLHIPFRPFEKFSKTMIDYNPLISVVCVASLLAIAVAKYRNEIMEHSNLVLPYFLIAFALYAFLYFVGWWVFPKTSIANKVAYYACSGCNNIGLGVTLTILYFTPEMNIFFIIAQFSWAIILIPARWIRIK